MAGRPAGRADRIGGKRTANAGSFGTTGEGRGQKGGLQRSAKGTPAGGGSGNHAAHGGHTRSLVDHGQAPGRRGGSGY